MQFLHTEDFDELCWLGCVPFWKTVVSIIDSEKIIFEIACQPITRIRVEAVRGRGTVGRQTYQSIGLQFVSFAYIDQYDSSL